MSRPLPRLHAITDATILALPDLGVRAAAIAAAGSAVALHARARGATGQTLAAAATRFVSLCRPPEAAVFVNARPDVAQAVGAHGVQLGADDLTPSDARRVLRSGWIGRSVHNFEEASLAAADGADFLLAGTIYETPSHPDQPPAGLDLVRACARLGLPVIAIGGITAERTREVRDAGAYGAAAIRALWHARDPARAALELLEAWIL